MTAHPLLLALVALATSVPAQKQFDELAKRGFPVHQDRTSAAAFADVDGDGDLDLLFGNIGQNRLLLNDGAGSYANGSAQLPVAANDSAGLAPGDVDGDGDVDFVIANGSGNNQLYLNDGTGRFTDVSALQMPASADTTFSVALGDVDGDNDLDIVYGNFGQNRLFLNDGAGTFSDATGQQLPVDNDTTLAVAIADVDADGDLDLVLGNGRGGRPEQNKLYLNDGTGLFADVTAAQMPASLDLTTGLALGDVDGDGDLDLIQANDLTAQNSLYLNDGSGGFSDASGQLPPDLDFSHDVALGDVDGDGDLDAVFANVDLFSNGGQNRLYLNDGSGTFTDATVTAMPLDSDSSEAVALGDADGDGRVEIVFANEGAGVPNRFYLNDGRGVFTDTAAVHMPRLSAFTRVLVPVDVDEDGDMDVVAGNGSFAGEQNRIYLNDGRGSFSVDAGRLPVLADATRDIAVADVDGDGDPDLFVGNESEQSRLLLNDGAGFFTDGTSGRLPIAAPRTMGVALVDVDGDGDRDAVLANIGPNQLFLNDGGGNFSDVSAARLPAANERNIAVATVDADGDGDIDLVFAGNFDQSVLYLNDGSGTFTDATAQLPSYRGSTETLEAGDVDGDGDVDLVFGDSGRDQLYLNDGAGVFTDVTATQMPATSFRTASLALGDVEGDGDADIVAGDAGNRTLLLLNDGAGTFIDVSAARMPIAPLSGVGPFARAVAFADVDADGDLDMLLGTQGSNKVLFNLRRHLAAPLLARIGRTYTLDAYRRFGSPSPAEFAVPFLAGGRASIPLPPLGVLGLDPTTLLSLPAFMVAQPQGTGSTSFTMPRVRGFVGSSLFAQVVIFPALVPARLSNVTADVILR